MPPGGSFQVNLLSLGGSTQGWRTRVNGGREGCSGETAFVPITLKASPVEIELPNGGVVRLPLGVGQVVLVEVIRAVGALRPWKAPKS